MTNETKGTRQQKTGGIAALIGAIVGGIACSELFGGTGSLFSWQWGVGMLIGGVLGCLIAGLIVASRTGAQPDDNKMFGTVPPPTMDQPLPSENDVLWKDEFDA
ncbi:MAG: hypothetical protein AAB403_08670, partial [Planctomycetota bacterium]